MASDTAETESDPRLCHFSTGGMGRGILETAYSLPGRAWRRARLEDMTREERDFAHFSKEMYVQPDQRQTNLRGYTLVEGCTEDSSVSLNATRWGVYRAPNGIDHVLAFRGTADRDDLLHDVNLIAGFGEHPLIMDAAVWSSRVMLFLSKKHREESGSNESRLSFKVAGHSLGGAVAMGVVILLYDVLAVALHLRQVSESADDESPDLERFLRDIALPWAVASAAKNTVLPHELSGGHIFNPGSFNRLGNQDEGDLYRYMGISTSVAAGFMSAEAYCAGVAGTAAVGASTCFALAGIMAVASGGGLLVLSAAAANYVTKKNRGGDDRADKRVTTHHILGDLISCSFRLGDEKNYLAKTMSGRLLCFWTGSKFKESGAHSIENFIE